MDACSAVFSSIVVLPSAHCCLNSVLFHTKCFHCFLPVLCFMMAILSVNRRFFRLVILDALQLFLRSLFCLLNMLELLVQHWFVSRAKNYCTGDVCCESKVLFEVFLLFFFQCFFSWWQFCPLIGEFYVSDGWFFDFSLIIWGKPSSSQSQITSLKSKITNLKHNSLINGHNCHHKTKHRQEIKL